MLKLKKYTPTYGSASPCFHCDLFQLCSKSLSNDGTIKQEVLNQIHHPQMSIANKEHIMEALSYAIRCKKQYPQYYVKNEYGTQHVLVGKFGNEILRANSFWGLWGSMFGAIIVGLIIFTIIALVFCGIGSIFK